MTQLILDTGGYNIVLPESRKGGYSASKTDISVEVEMITGRMTKELRGEVWFIAYQYGYFDAETKNQIIAACEKGRRQAINCGFLPPDSTGALKYSDFFVSAFNYPRFMWSRKVAAEDGSISPVPMWADFSVELREVKPND